MMKKGELISAEYCFLVSRMSFKSLERPVKPARIQYRYWDIVLANVACVVMRFSKLVHLKMSQYNLALPNKAVSC